MPFRKNMLALSSRRTFWVTRIESAVIEGRYSDAEVHREVRTPVAEPEGHLIASLTENGRHAPALDFDFAVEAMPLTASRTRLSFPGLRVRPRPWRKLLRRMASLGMLYPGYDCDYEPWEDAGVKTMRMDVVVPVHVAPSSTPGHHHVYLDVELPWSAYLKLCKAMEKAGLLEADFVALMKSHGMSMLLKPGLTKRQLLERGCELPGLSVGKRQAPEYPRET